ncbi:MAG: hypothetical protein AAGI72_06585 [Pseudomonadota bacterium]
MREPLSAERAATKLEALAASLREGKRRVNYVHLHGLQGIYKGMRAEYKRLNPVPVSPIGGSNPETLV